MKDENGTAGPASPPPPEFLADGGEVGMMMRAHDWASSPLGPPEHWPQSLKTVVRIMQTSRYAMWMGWGPDLLFFYNDAYRPTLGVKHPDALGMPARDVWAEVWSEVEARRAIVFGRGEATWDERLLLLLERSGYIEETYHTFSYSPLPGDAGGVEGMLCVVTEETERVIGERRLDTLRGLGTKLAGINTEEEVLDAFGEVLATNRRDVPFAMIYLFEPNGTGARLAAACGIVPGHAAAPLSIDVADAEQTWPAAEILAAVPSTRHLYDLDTRFSDLPMGDWVTPAREALVIPIARQNKDRPAGFMIAGINPLRTYDADYAGFLELIAGQIEAALGNAHAYAEERRRAEALAELDRAKTSFFSNVSHEFRTPLTLMLGPMEEVLAKPVGAIADDDRRLIEVSHRNGLRLLQLVNSLLDYSRVSAGRSQARYKPTDLATATADIASNFRSAMEREGLRFEVDCPPLPQPVHVDPRMWETIVINLLSNAFKFTMAGEVSVHLGVSDDRESAELRVRDTGSGIPADELPKLFDRFHRVEGTRGRSFEGSGIGLALVLELVQLHGGSIMVESEPAAGSTFRVRVPFGTAHLPADRLDPGVESGISPDASRSADIAHALYWLTADEDGPEATGEHDFSVERSAGERILLADDNADMRGYINRLLTAQGYTVETVADGAAALAAARRQPPSLILTDVMMPNLDGFGLLRALRADSILREIPVVLLSARAGEEAHAEGVAAGADDYLIKPFSSRELLARVASSLANARMRRETERTLRSEVAERIQTEAALRESETRFRDLAQSLETRVGERTRELAEANAALRAQIEERERVEQALRQAQKMEGIGQLTGGVAHDFNNLLTIIIGNLESLQRQIDREDLEPTRMRRWAENAHRGAQRAASLTQRLLAFSRRQPLEPRPVDPNRLVAGMSDLLRRTLGETIEVETVLSGGLWWTHADPNQLESAILNLAVNARDAMPGGGRLTIETANAFLDEGYAARQAEVAPGQYVVLCISDSGTGMSREVLAQAFEPFFTTKDVGHGTGLGLSQVYGFVKQSGGHVKIYSEPGEGTTVKIYLPRLLAAVEDAQPAERTQQEAKGSRSETILVVEDDQDVRHHSVEILSELGYRVIEAATGAAGLEQLADHPEVKLLFTDVGLPGGMNGRQLADAARQLRPRLSVLFTTGYAKNAIVHDGRLDAGVHLITKPFTYAALAAKVRDVLDVRSGPPCLLLVEDEPLVRMVVAEALDEQGFKVEEAASATEAINKMRLLQGRVDAAVVDVGLPDRKGDALAAELRAMDAALPIVIASGYDGDSLRDRFAADPLVAFLEKPYEAHQLAAVLAQFDIKPPAGG